MHDKKLILFIIFLEMLKKILLVNSKSVQAYGQKNFGIFSEYLKKNFCTEI